MAEKWKISYYYRGYESCFEIMNRYLLDTNILAFLAGGDMDELSNEVKIIIDDYSNHLETSSISLIELVQLYRIGKIRLKKGQSIKTVLETLKKTIGIVVANFTEKHIYTLSNMEAVEGHNDPFDHAIISHAISDHYTLISSDRKFKYYKNQRLSFVYNKR